MVDTFFGRREPWELRHDLVAEIISDMADAGSTVLHFDQRSLTWDESYWKDREPVRIYDCPGNMFFAINSESVADQVAAWSWPGSRYIAKKCLDDLENAQIICKMCFSS